MFQPKIVISAWKHLNRVDPLSKRVPIERSTPTPAEIFVRLEKNHIEYTHRDTERVELSRILVGLPKPVTTQNVNLLMSYVVVPIPM